MPKNLNPIATQATTIGKPTTTPGNKPTTAPGNKPTINSVEKSVNLNLKFVGQFSMLAVEGDGVRFTLLGTSLEFFVPASHANYAAMFSLLLAIQSENGEVAVKYFDSVVGSLSNRRTVNALARGISALIKGDFF